MKNTLSTILKIMIIFLVIKTLTSCTVDQDLNNLDDTIFVRHQNADMPAHIQGNGSEKVFLITLHGGPGDQGLAFKGKAFDQIEENNAVVYFDQRGSGASQGSYSDEDVSVDLMAEDVLALVKVLKRKYGDDSRFFLLGFSWGGTLGTATLLKDQSDFLGWINVDGPVSWTSWYSKYLDDYERVASEQIALGNSITYWESVNDLLEDVSPTYNITDFFRLNNKSFQAQRVLGGDGLINGGSATDDLLYEYNLFTFFRNRRGIQRTLIDDPNGERILVTLSFTDRLQEITTPTLLLWGRHDVTVPISFAEETLENTGATNKELIFFERSGHIPFSKEPDLFASEVIRFINENK